jgi:hypothetical protein
MKSFLLVANIGRRGFGWFPPEFLSLEKVRLGSVAAVWCFCGEVVLPCRLPAMGFSGLPPLSLPFFLFPFLSHFCVRCKRFSLLSPTRAIEDHLRCKAADTGRIRAPLLGDERSGSLWQGKSVSKRAMRDDSGSFRWTETAVRFS